LCSRDHAFLSHILATPTTVLKTVDVNSVSGYVNVILLFQKSKWNMKTSLGGQYALIGIIYNV